MYLRKFYLKFFFFLIENINQFFHELKEKGEYLYRYSYFIIDVSIEVY